jgi:hypothetical protein
MSINLMKSLRFAEFGRPSRQVKAKQALGFG